MASLATIRRQYRPDMTDEELRWAIATAASLADSSDGKSRSAGRNRLKVLREIKAARQEAA